MDVILYRCDHMTGIWHVRLRQAAKVGASGLEVTADKGHTP